MLRFAQKDIGGFSSIESAQLFLVEKYGNENVKNLGEFTPMITIHERTARGKRIKKVVPQSNREKCIAFECKSKDAVEGWICTSRYELEFVPILG